MGATKIMVIRHAEKPGQYAGVNNLGTVAGVDGAKHLVRPTQRRKPLSFLLRCFLLFDRAAGFLPPRP